MDDCRYLHANGGVLTDPEGDDARPRPLWDVDVNIQGTLDDLGNEGRVSHVQYYISGVVAWRAAKVDTDTNGIIFQVLSDNGVGEVRAVRWALSLHTGIEATIKYGWISIDTRGFIL